MRRTAIWIICLMSAACIVWAQRGNGGGAGMPHTAPQVSHPSGTNAPAGAQTHGQGQTSSLGKAGMDVPARMTANPALSARLTPLLPAGVTMQDAAAGFRNQGQFVAALHVAKNLSIPFADLKTAMTGEKPLFLGAAIHQLRPDLQKDAVNEQVKTAEVEAKVDLRAK